jgi:hypothetical protein
MQHDILASLSRLSDHELVSRTRAVVARVQGATALLVAHIAELDTRDVHLRAGFSSLFVYCRDALGLSDSEIGTRIEVARAARRFPVILDMLESGAVHLTAVRLLAPHLTAANHREALAAARRKTKIEVQQIVARLAPRPDVPLAVRKLPAPAAPAPPPPPAASVPAGSSPAAAPPLLVPSSHAPGPPLPAPAPASKAAVTPLSPDRYKLQLTIAGETLEKLRLAQDMLGHAVPDGDGAKVLDRALTALLCELAKKKFADTDRPRRTGAGNPRSRTPSAAVKRAVWVRDLGRCRFVGKNGHRCEARRFLEFHHLDPYALGGEATVDGIVLMCAAHNKHEATLYFGKRTPRAGPGEVREEPPPYGQNPSRLPADMFQNMLDSTT